MDFLLECIGFPPGSDLADLARMLVSTRASEPLGLAGGLELHVEPDRADPSCAASASKIGGESSADAHDRLTRAAAEQERRVVWPAFNAGRLQQARVVHSERSIDTPFDALIDAQLGYSRPQSSLAISAFAYGAGARQLLDGRPATFSQPRLAQLRLAGFALDVERLSRPTTVERFDSDMRGHGTGWLRPLVESDAPDGCVELELEISSVQILDNPISGCAVELLEVQSSCGPLNLFASPWQLSSDRWPAPQPGDWIRGTFLLVARCSDFRAAP